VRHGARRIVQSRIARDGSVSEREVRSDEWRVRNGSDKNERGRFLSAWADIIAGAMMKEKASARFARNGGRARSVRSEDDTMNRAPTQRKRLGGGGACVHEVVKVEARPGDELSFICEKAAPVLTI
jgi:hypothetical protein